MDIKEFSTLIKEKAKELDDMAKHRLPVKIGRMAKDHYQDNFRKGGFVNKRLLIGCFIMHLILQLLLCHLLFRL